MTLRLCFIEYHLLWKACHKPQWVITCGSQHCAVVEGRRRCILAPAGGLGWLADLTRAKDANDWGIAESVQYLLLQIAWVKSRGHRAA